MRGLPRYGSALQTAFCMKLSGCQRPPISMSDLLAGPYILGKPLSLPSPLGQRLQNSRQVQSARTFAGLGLASLIFFLACAHANKRRPAYTMPVLQRILCTCLPLFPFHMFREQAGAMSGQDGFIVLLCSFAPRLPSEALYIFWQDIPPRSFPTSFHPER